MSRRKPRDGYRWARFADFYVTLRREWGGSYHIVRIRGRQGVWLGVYRSERAAHRAIDTAVHQRAVEVLVGDMDHPLFDEQTGRYVSEVPAESRRARKAAKRDCPGLEIRAFD